VPDPSPLWDERQAPSLANAAILAVIGGFLDAFTYVGHGHVFANAMTGNVVLLGIYGIAQDWQQSFRHLPPIITFVIGIIAARGLLSPRLRHRLRYPYVAVLIGELIIIGVLTLLPNSTPDMWITTSIAFAASMQVETFRTVNGRNFNSTFTTGNLRSLSEGLFDLVAGQNRPDAQGKTSDFAIICLTFFTGATVGGFSTSHFGNRALFFSDALLLVLLIRLWPRRESAIESASLQPAAQRSDS
jgi:uncharacterized membrane protein YoaK (UPF0700 family)